MGIPREHNTSKRSAVFLPADCLTVGMPVQGMFDLSVKRIFIFFFGITQRQTGVTGIVTEIRAVPRVKTVRFLSALGNLTSSVHRHGCSSSSWSHLSCIRHQVTRSQKDGNFPQSNPLGTPFSNKLQAVTVCTGKW